VKGRGLVRYHWCHGGFLTSMLPFTTTSCWRDSNQSTAETESAQS